MWRLAATTVTTEMARPAAQPNTRLEASAENPRRRPRSSRKASAVPETNATIARPRRIPNPVPVIAAALA